MPVRFSPFGSSLRMSGELRGARWDQPRFLLIDERVKAKFAGPAVSYQCTCLNDGLKAPLCAFAGCTICIALMKHQEGTLFLQNGNACIERPYERIH